MPNASNTRLSFNSLPVEAVRLFQAKSGYYRIHRPLVHAKTREAARAAARGPVALVVSILVGVFLVGACTAGVTATDGSVRTTGQAPTAQDTTGAPTGPLTLTATVTFLPFLMSPVGVQDEPAESTVPTEPAEPAVPTEPAEPSEPTEPAEPAVPTEPAEPSEPAVPADLVGLVVHMEKTACEGPCPVYSVDVQGDGTILYNGKTCVNVVGEQTDQIAQEQVRELVEAFDQNDFFSLDDAYVEDIQDIPAILIRFTLRDQTKQVVKQVYDPRKAPAALERLEGAIDRIANTQQWVTADGTPVPCP